MKTKLTNLTKEQFYNYVGLGMSRQAIANELEVTLHAVRKWMESNSVSLQGRQLTARKLPINSNYWKTDGFAEAYWAGFIAADGSVSEDGRLEIGLQASDERHLIKLKEALGSQHKIEHKLANRKYPSVYFRPRDSEIVSDLRDIYNIVPRKSLIYEMPPWITKTEYMPHFMRGYIDGDGCIHIGDPSHSITITSGSSNFSTSVSEWLNYLGIPHGKHTTKDNCTNVTVGSKSGILKLLSVLYDDSTESTRLDRKFVKYKDMLNKLKV
jgi:hypothetical protein